jgi:hypothetical protein
MSKWKFHNEWAVRFGIPVQTSNWVNKREDLPKFDSCNDKKLESLRLTMPNRPLHKEFAELGTDYLKGWYLHMVIDYLEDNLYFYLMLAAAKRLDIPKFLDEIRDDLNDPAYLRKEYDNRFHKCKELTEIVNFVSDNLDELTKQLVSANLQSFISYNNIFGSPVSTPIDAVMAGTKFS